MYATRADRMRASEIRELLKLLDQPDIISFAGGIPDPQLFPDEAFRTGFQNALSDGRAWGTSLQYSVSERLTPPLRQWIVRQMAAIGVPCAIDNIADHLGSVQQALDYLGQALPVSIRIPPSCPGRLILVRCRPSMPMSPVTID